MSYEERIALLSGFLICRTCGVKKKAEGNFPIRSEGKKHRGGGYRRQCRDCLAKIEKERRANLGEEYLKSERERHKRHKETTSTLRVRLKIVKTMINNPVFKHEVKAKESLKSLSILKFAQGTNFPVTDDEWAVISGLITSREKNKR